MFRTRAILALPLLLWTSACSAASIFSLTPTPTAYIYPTAETPFVPALTVKALENAEYILPGFGGAVYSCQFTDGKYEIGDPDISGFASLSLLDFFAFGDLNDDGVNDAAVLIAENRGGTGVFVSVNAVLNDGGRPRHAASYMIDDRPQINALEINDGVIFLDALVHDLNDPACCPEQAVRRSFKISGAALTLVQATLRLANGRERAILIESPADEVEVSGELVISGRVTIAPFENTLTYRVYNEQGNELSVGAVTVSAAAPGAPGAFVIRLDTGSFPMGRIRIVIADLSAADGSVFALDSVEVLVR